MQEKRRGWDSNPRTELPRSTVFKTVHVVGKVPVVVGLYTVQAGPWDNSWDSPRSQAEHVPVSYPTEEAPLAKTLQYREALSPDSNRSGQTTGARKYPGTNASSVERTRRV